MLPKTSRTLLALAVACGAGAALTPAAQAAYPGDNGQIAYVKYVDSGLYRVYVANADGTGERELTKNFDIAGHPAWSPDGKRLVYNRRGGSEPGEVRIVDPVTGVDVPLGVVGENPTWSPDGTKIAFEQDGDVYVRSSDPTDTAEPVLLTPGEANGKDPAWSSKDEIAFIRTEGAGNDNVWVMPATGDVDGAAWPVSRDAQDEAAPDWSPDGTKLAYTRTDDGGEVWVQAPTKAAEPFQPAGETVDADPVWSPDGTKILWRSTRKWNDLPGTRLWTANPADDATPALIVGAGVADGDGLMGLQPDWQPVVTPEDPQEPEDPQDPEQPEDPKDPQQPEQPKDDRPAPQQPQTPAPQPQPQPQPQPTPAPQATPRTTVVTSKSCVSRRKFTITLPSKGRKVSSATATLAGKPVPVTVGRKGRAVIDLRKKPKGTFTVEIAVKTSAGTIKQTRRFRTCAPKRRA